MSILMGVFEEELDRLNRQERVYRAELEECRKGYISKKSIQGREAYYLQWREGQKVKSQYISREDLPNIEAQIKRRKQLEESLRRVKEDQKRLRKVLK